MTGEHYTVTTAPIDDFFRQGREIAQKLDRGEKVEPIRLISFEDPEDLLELLTTGRVALFRAIKNEPDSIAGIARRLHRDRSAVKRDVDILVSAGIVEVEDRPLPSHGRMKFVKPLADTFNLTFQMG
jgi:predicted transcriptional regulator